MSEAELVRDLSHPATARRTRRLLQTAGGDPYLRAAEQLAAKAAEAQRARRDSTPTPTPVLSRRDGGPRRERIEGSETAWVGDYTPVLARVDVQRRRRSDGPR